MTDVFDIHSSGDWSYTAEASTVLSTTTLAQAPGGLGASSTRAARSSSRSTTPATGPRSPPASTSPTPTTCRPAQFNRVLWRGLMGSKPYPAIMGAHNESRHVADADND